MAQGVYLLAFYGVEFMPGGNQHLEKIRNRGKIADAILAKSKSMSPALVLLLLSARLRDPVLHVILLAMAAARRFLCHQSRC